MPDKNPSRSIIQRMDDFKRDFGNILRGFSGRSNDTPPPGLPTAMKKPVASHSEKGNQSDESD